MYYGHISFPIKVIFLVFIIASFSLANFSVTFMNLPNPTNTLESDCTYSIV